jgi:hypothetical protein
MAKRKTKKSASKKVTKKAPKRVESRGKRFGEFDPWGLGIALAVLWGGSTFLTGLFAMWGSGSAQAMVGWLSGFYMGYAATYVGSLFGLLWGALDGLVGGLLIGWLYNHFRH